MKPSDILTISSLVAVATAQSNATNAPNATTCVSGAHVIVARASGEQPGYGILGAVKDQILARIPNSNAVAVPYPATIFGPVVYVDSEPEGVGNMTELIKAYGDACPGRKMVLMGYSQGAQVVGDSVIGSYYIEYPSFPNTTALSQKYLDNIAAIIMMGDPANVVNVPIDKGNSTKNGTFPRSNAANWTSMGLVNRTISYCDADDLFCAQGGSLAVHLGYIGEYGNQAADFIVQKMSAAASSSTSTSSSSTPTSSGSPTSSASGGSTSSSASASPSASHNAGSTVNGVSSLVPGLSSYTVVGIFQCIFATLLLSMA